jgi:hypothetical protein
VPAQSWGFIRIGGIFEGQVDERYIDFRFLLNGPQIILLLGSLVIVGAGYFAHRRLDVFFCSPEGSELIKHRREAVCGIEPIIILETPPPGEQDATPVKAEDEKGRTQ